MTAAHSPRRAARPAPAPPLLNHSYITFIGHWRGQLCILVVVLAIGLVYFVVREPIEAWRRRRRERESAVARCELLAAEREKERDRDKDKDKDKDKERDDRDKETDKDKERARERDRERERKKEGKRRKSVLRPGEMGGLSASALVSASASASGSASGSPSASPAPSTRAAAPESPRATKTAVPCTPTSNATPKSKKNRSSAGGSVTNSALSMPRTPPAPPTPQIRVEQSDDALPACMDAYNTPLRAASPLREPIQLGAELVEMEVDDLAGAGAGAGTLRGRRTQETSPPSPWLIPLPPSPAKSMASLAAMHPPPESVDSRSDAASVVSASISASASASVSADERKRDEGFSIYPEDGYLPPGVGKGMSGKKKKKRHGQTQAQAQAQAQGGNHNAPPGASPRPVAPLVFDDMSSLPSRSSGGGGGGAPESPIPPTPRRHSRKTSLGFRTGTIEEQLRERDEIIDQLRAEIGVAKAEEAKAESEAREARESVDGKKGWKEV